MEVDVVKMNKKSVKLPRFKPIDIEQYNVILWLVKKI